MSDETETLLKMKLQKMTAPTMEFSANIGRLPEDDEDGEEEGLIRWAPTLDPGPFAVAIAILENQVCGACLNQMLAEIGGENPQQSYYQLRLMDRITQLLDTTCGSQFMFMLESAVPGKGPFRESEKRINQRWIH